MRRFSHENGLSLLFGLMFLATLAGQALAGQRNHNAGLVEHGENSLSWWQYVVSPDFGGAVMENWQSEFLAVGSIVIFSVFLRQRGSPESKPVGAPHDETASSG